MKKIDYFSNIKDIGSLDIEEIICEYDFPVLFTLINNKSHKRYIAVCCDVVYEQRWIISPISVANIIKLLKDQIDIYSSFKTDLNAECIIAHWKKNEGMRYEYITCSKLADEELPLKGDFLEADDGEFDEYIKKLETNEIIELVSNEVLLPVDNIKFNLMYQNNSASKVYYPISLYIVKNIIEFYTSIVKEAIFPQKYNICKKNNNLQLYAEIL